MSDVRNGVEKLLNHVMSIKALSSIKTAIHSKLTAAPNDKNTDPTPWAELWASTCQLVLKRELSLWDTFFQAPLLHRVKVALFSCTRAGPKVGDHVSEDLCSHVGGTCKQFV